MSFKEIIVVILAFFLPPAAVAIQQVRDDFTEIEHMMLRWETYQERTVVGPLTVDSWLIDWFADWLIDWLIASSVDWLIGQRVD